ncbi:MAG: cation-translocating P-type ATPase [Myxococcaceae bacterium]|nr:cation-translocating P-type ATPase [Myxococcaceae bacterium]
MATPASTGLTGVEAQRLLSMHGPNEIQRAPRRSKLAILGAQFKSPLIALLAAAAAISLWMGELADAVAIAAILVINAAVGFLQEYRAETAVLALRAITAPRARVVRDGHAQVIPSAELVPGDLLLLEAGDVVGADARLIDAHALSTIEAALTGESLPSEKSLEPVPDDAPLAERSDRVFMGTSVATGTGRALVTHTGMRTELGKIAHLLSTARDGETPLQRRLAQVSRTLLFLSIAVVVTVFAVGLLRRGPILGLLLTSISLAVAAVPEGLPAIVTIALAIGVQRMAARNVLVRRLPSVETLGAATVICTDKTGTLTTGRMEVREVWGEDRLRVLGAAAACCDAELDESERWGTGDPTELALLVEAAKLGIRRADIEARAPRVTEHPFDARRKRMSVLRADGVLYVKGAVDHLVPLCVAGVDGALAANAEMAARGLRVIGVATGRTAEEQGLTLVGLVGIADPPRSEAIEAVAAARRAGIRTVMITGDHPVTARAIARELGIATNDAELAERVHARATPEDKLRIIREWRARGDVVAMTGDGVNDAPALREADIGIAMGITGTEVTREASDMVLADDNFASIVAAVREGRAIYGNIRKTLTYLLAGNAGELLTVLVASIIGLPVPLLPIQLLWINLVTDGLPALALVMDPPDRDVLAQPPRRPGEEILGRHQWWTVGAIGALEATITLSAYAWMLASHGVEKARTMAFCVLVFCEVLRAFAARSPQRTLWEVGALSNLKLVGVVVLTFGLQLAIGHVPGLAALFQMERFDAADWAIALALGFVPVSLIELAKLARRPARAVR